uniref:Uncharacterized protein n=1 Tax=Siphoviridae sp. ctxdc10 TaxID=2825740 RepID=A0A8S5TSF6_9CAUD|nr:MAG TPA: hypothetical protein [Siphoviridae sp. ctxdc10]DAU60184.1 MAG TPA: hypothetical protein [Caudoviricetes sp.]
MVISIYFATKTAVLLPAAYHHRGCRIITITAQGITAVNYVRA